MFSMYSLYLTLIYLTSIFASSIPLQTISAAASRTSSSSLPTITPQSCHASCFRLTPGVSFVSWQQNSITATITVETLIYIVNDKTNTTRTTTITNTEADLTGYTPLTDTDSAGTRTTTVIETAGQDVTTHTVAFPTFFYPDYPSTYAICGELPTSTAGSTSCIEKSCDSGSLTFSWPTHPPLPPDTVTSPAPVITLANIAPDPRGLTYEPIWVNNGSDWAGRLQPLMPNLGLWSCRLPATEEPDTVKFTALYLTATSTSTEADSNSAIHPTSSSFVILEEAAATRPDNSPASTPPSSQAPKPVSSLTSVLAPHTDAAVIAQPVSSSAIATSTAQFVDSNGDHAPSPSEAIIIVPTPASARNAAAPQGSQAPSVTATPEIGPNVLPTSENNQETPPVSPGQVGEADAPENAAPATTTSPILINGQPTSEIVNSQTPIEGQPQVPGMPTTSALGSSTVAMAPPAFTIGSETVTGNTQNQYLVDGQTLTPGGVVTASGTPISLAVSATEVIVGSSTQGLGGLIMSGLGGGPVGTIGVGGGIGGSGGGSGSANTTGTGVLGFTGDASETLPGLRYVLILMVGLVLGVA